MKETGKKNWLKSARVRMTQLARAKYSKGYAHEEVSLTRRYGCDTLVFFVEIDGWLLYPSKYTKRDFTIRNHDLVRDLCEACKKHDIKFVAAFMGMHCQTCHLRKHPDWCLKHHSSLFPDSPFAGHKRASQEKDVMSLHSPYRHVLLGAMGEVLARYDPDGVYFDGLYCPPGYDYSKWSVEEFQKRFGREVPSDYFDADWIKWSLSQVPDFCRDAAALISDHNPETALIVDCHGPTMACIDSGENVLESCNHVDAFMMECYFEHSGEHPSFVVREGLALAAETRRPVWHARWLTRSPGHVSVCEPKAMALNWFCDAVATGNAPALVDQDAFWHDRSLEKPMKHACTQYRKLRRFIGDSEPLSHVAIFHSTNRKFERLQEDVLAVRAPYEGFCRVLEEAHIPFTMITERDIREGVLGQFQSLVIPGVEEISDDVAERIESFVSAGGGLVATFRTSFSDETGQVRKQPALASVLGIKKIKGGWLRCPTYSGYDYGWPSDNVPGNLFELDGVHPVTKGLLRENLYSYSGRLIKADMSSESKVVVSTRLHDAKLARSGRFFRYQPTQSRADPLVYTRRHKKGRVVWFSGDVDRAVWERGNAECAMMLKNATRWVTRGTCPVECDASPLVVLRVRRNIVKGIWQIGLSNYAQSQIHSPGFAGTFPVKAPQFKRAIGRKEVPRHIATFTNVKVSIDWPSGGKPQMVTLSGVQPDYRKRGDCLELTVRELREGEVIAVGAQN